MTPEISSFRAVLRLAMLMLPAWTFAGVASGPEIDLITTSYDFGTVPVTQGPGFEAPFAIFNTGASDLTIDEITLSGDDPGDFQIVNAPSLDPIPAGGYRIVKVIYAPRRVANHSANLEIKSSDPDEPVLQIPLNGSSTNVAPVTLNDDYSTLEDTELVLDPPGILANDYDPDGVPNGLIVTFVSKPAAATLEVSQKGGLTYMPAPDYNGPEDQVYLVHDGFDVSNPGAIHIDVISVIDPPALSRALSMVLGPTNQRSVSVQLDTPSMPDPPQVVDLSESPNFDSFASVPYTGQEEASYTLVQPGDGDRQIYVRLRNEGGSSDARSVTVTLDETAPGVDPALPLQVFSSASLDPTNVDVLIAVRFTEPVFSISGAIPGVTNGAVDLGGTVDTSGLTAGLAYPVRKSAANDPTYIRITGSVPASGILTVGFKSNALRDAAGNVLAPPAPVSIALSSSISDWQLLN